MNFSNFSVAFPKSPAIISTLPSPPDCCITSVAPIYTAHYKPAKIQALEALKDRSSIRLIIAALGLLYFSSAQAQQIPRPSLSRLKDAAPSIERPYNLKIGPIAFTMGTSLGIEFVDNVNLTSSANGAQSDIILTPNLGITAVWQVTKLNSLDLRTTFGYQKFLQNPELDSQTALISPDSEIRLNLFIGDIKLIFRERFSLEQDTVNTGGVSGLARLPRFTNTVGVTALWDLNDITWTLAFDRFDLITTGNAGNTQGNLNNYSLLDRNSHQLSSAMIFRLGPTTQLGLEGTAALVRYPKNPNADSTVFTLGPFLDIQLTRYTRLTIGGGYQIYETEGQDTPPGSFNQIQPILSGAGALVSVPQTGTSNPRQSGDGSSYYFNLTLSHRLNRWYQDRLTISHDLQFGLLGDRAETTMISYGSDWSISRRFSLATNVFFSNIHQTSNFIGTSFAAVPDYQRYGATISTSYQVNKKLNVSLRYQFTKETSESNFREYAQNRIGVQFGYQF